MKRLSPLLLLLAAAPAFAAANAPLTLDEAVTTAVEHNNEVQATQHAVQSARYGLKASYGKFLPQLNLDGRYTRLNEAITIDLNDIRSAIISANLATLQAGGITNPLILSGFNSKLNAALPAFQLDVQKEDYYNFTASLVQPLFTGGKLLANKNAKKAELNVALGQDLLTKNKVVVDAVTAYCRVQFMKDLVQIRKDVADGLAEHQANAEKLLAQGVISQANKMRADVALAEAQREYSKSLKDRELATVLLNNALGTSETGFDLSSPLFLSGSVAPVEKYITAGNGNNPGLQMIAHKKRQLREKYNATRAEFLPTIALFGKYEVYRNDLTLFEPLWAAGVNARINVFNGASDFNTIKSVTEDLKTLDYYYATAANQVATGVRKYYIDLESAKEQFDSLEKSRELAEENLRLNRLSFREGVATSLEVIDAELALGKVKAEQSKALFDYDVALVNLLGTAGNAEEILNYRPGK